MFRQLSVFAAAVAAFLSVGPASAQIFSDDLSSSTNWTIAQTTDASAEFGFDYATKGIPVAPRGSGTVGLKLEVNNGDATASIDHIIAVNANAAYTGRYTARVDMWLNWALVAGTVGAGTTEFAGVSVGHDGSTQNTNGATLIFDGDGDTANDYRLYKNAALQTPASAQYATGTAANANDNANPAYMAAFPTVNVATAVPTQGQTGNTLAGAAGFQWMTLNVEVDTAGVGPSGANPANLGYARFTLYSHASKKSIVVGTIDNSNVAAAGVNMTGAFGLMASDIFSSVTTNTAFDFIIFDNVTVLAGLVPMGGPGDFDNSVAIDGLDFLRWQRGATPDLGSDAEFTTWKNNFGGGAVTSVSAATSIPEPASDALLLACATAFLRGRRAIMVRA